MPEHFKRARTCVFGFQRRSDAGYRAAREAVESGRLGWIHSLYAVTCDPAPPPAAYIATSGGIFRDMLIHDFDILRFVTGREVVRVTAVGGNKGEAFFRAADDVDTAAAVLTFDDGTVASVSGTRYNGAGYDVRLGSCRSMPTARSKPPDPPKTSLLFGHNAAALLPHRASLRRIIRLRSAGVHTPTAS